MTTWLDFLRIRTKLGLLTVFFLAALGVCAAGLYATSRALEARMDVTLSMETAQRQAQDAARSAQVHFKREVQEWKDLLLRGEDEADRTAYHAAMVREAGRVKKDLGALEQSMSARGLPLPPELQAIRATTADMARKYEEALSAVKGPWHPQTLDRAVRGLDRPPTAAMDDLVVSMEAATQRMETQDREELHARFAVANRRITILLVVLFGLGALLAHAIAKRLQEALDHLLHAYQQVERGDLAVRLHPGGRDELYELGLAFNGMAGRLQLTHQDLAAARDRAEEASRVKSAFVASMSHELRTPLNAILGYTQLLEGSVEMGEEDRGDVQKIRTAGYHLLDLINDILSIAKIEADHLELNLVPFSPEALLGEMRDLLGPRAREKGLAFSVEAEGALPDALLGDAVRLRQILLNLLGNAVKFTKHGEVRLRCAYQEGWATFAVTDTGPGIATEDQTLIFTPFHQAEAGRHNTEGAGLGLTITQALVRIMGGRLQLTSTHGEGATFRVALPLAEHRGPLPVHLQGKAVLAPGEPPWTLLVVDDRQENRDLLHKIFTRAGFSVLCAPGGAEGLNLWRQSHPSLVWMDIRMPDMDGFQALAALRAEELERGLARTPVVAITASVMDQDDTTMLAAGFDAFVTKPFLEGDLFTCMERLLPLHYR